MQTQTPTQTNEEPWTTVTRELSASTKSFFDTFQTQLRKMLSPATTTVSPPTDDTTIWKIVFVMFIIVLFMCFLYLGIFSLSYYGTTSANTPIYLMNGVGNGYIPITISQNPEMTETYILRSNNRPGGIEFTWTIWLYVDKITSNGNPKTYQHILNKGNNQYDAVTGIATVNNAPGIYLSKGESTLRIIMDNLAGGTTSAGTADITNIPLKSWFQLALIAQNGNLDCYINGIIKKRINQVVSGSAAVKQNNDSIYLCQNGGFSGQYSDIFYYNYAISFMELQTTFYSGPALVNSDTNLQKEKVLSSVFRGRIKNYLSYLWYNPENSSVATTASPVDLSVNTIYTPPTKTTPPPATPPPPKQQDTIPTTNENKAPPSATIVQNGVIVGATLASQYDESGNLIRQGNVDKPLLDLNTSVGTVQTAIMDIVKAIAFALNSTIFNTPFYDYMMGDVRALDYHNIDCSGNSINGFNLVNRGDGTQNYSYKCNNPGGGNMTVQMPQTITPYSKTTGSIFDLSEHTVQCPTNTVLSQFQLFNNTPLGSEKTATQMQYRYKCLAPEANSVTAKEQPLTCRTETTGKIRSTNNSKFLANANVGCLANEAMSGFKFIPSADNKSFQYSYTCCKTPYS